MFRGIVKAAIIALGIVSAAPLAAQDARRPMRAGREWVQQHPRAARHVVRVHRHRQFRRQHPRMVRQQRMALRRVEFRRSYRGWR